MAAQGGVRGFELDGSASGGYGAGGPPLGAGNGAMGPPDGLGGQHPHLQSHPQQAGQGGGQAPARFSDDGGMAGFGAPGGSRGGGAIVTMSQARTFCLLAVLFWLLAFCLEVGAAVIDREFWTHKDATSLTGASYMDLYKEMDVALLRKLWVHRRSVGGLQGFGDACAAIAILLMYPAIQCLGEVFGRPRSFFMGTLFAAAAGILVLNLLFHAGTSTMADHMSTWAFFYNDIGDSGSSASPLQVLETAYLMALSRGMWVFGADALLVAVGVANVSTLTFVHGILSKWHGGFGILIFLLGLAAFSIDLMKMVDWQLWGGIAGLVMAVQLACVLIWTLWLGITLGNVRGREEVKQYYSHY